jgi:signal transduction histidine kinase
MDAENPDGNEIKEFRTIDNCWVVAQSCPTPMAAVAGADHIFQYVNPSFCLLTGKTKEELIGTAFAGAGPAGHDCLSLLARVYRTGKAESYMGQPDRASHRPYWSYVMWPILSPNGNRDGIMIQFPEITPLLLQTTEVNQALILSSVRQHQLADEAERLNERLQRANDDLKQFAFAASHDLQEPLRMITTYSQLLIRGYRKELDGEAAVCVGFIRDGTRYMQDLLTDLLSYTQTSADEADGREPVDLHRVFERVRQNLGPAIEESCAVVSSGDLPTISGHEARFSQLFQNLISNAIKYRGPEAPVIHISAEQRGNEWRIAVADNGMGIEPEHHKRIFGVFKRLHGKGIPGTGIGLAICQRVVEGSGGRIWVESQIGRGATFYFTLPASEGRK